MRMKTTILGILLCCVLLKSNAQIAEDKVLHFVGGNLFGAVGAGVASQLSKGDRAWTFIGSVGGSLLIGVAKEAIDQNQYGGWDNADILATVLGGVTAGVTIDIFKQRKKRRNAEIYRKAISVDNYRPVLKANGVYLTKQTPLTVLALSHRVQQSLPKTQP